MKNSSVRATTKQNIEERIATVRRQRILLIKKLRLYHFVTCVIVV